MRYVVSGSAQFDLAAVIDVPDGIPAEEFVRSEEGKEAVRTAFGEYWENTSIKLRDAYIIATSAQVEDSEEEMEPWEEVVEL